MGYNNAYNDKLNIGIIKIESQDALLESRLHPALDELIDCDKYRQQIKHGPLDNVDQGFYFMFSHTTYALKNSNIWLYDGQPPE